MRKKVRKQQGIYHWSQGNQQSEKNKTWQRENCYSLLERLVQIFTQNRQRQRKAICKIKSLHLFIASTHEVSGFWEPVGGRKIRDGTTSWETLLWPSFRISAVRQSGLRDLWTQLAVRRGSEKWPDEQPNDVWSASKTSVVLDLVCLYADFWCLSQQNFPSSYILLSYTHWSVIGTGKNVAC